MKNLMTALIVTMIATSAMAAPAVQKIQIHCKQTDVFNFERMTMILTQVSEGNGMDQGEWLIYNLELRQGLDQILSEKVYVMNEDVLFQFNNRKAGIEGTIYMDEMDEAGATINGERMSFDCN